MYGRAALAGVLLAAALTACGAPKASGATYTADAGVTLKGSAAAFAAGRCDDDHQAGAFVGLGSGTPVTVQPPTGSQLTGILTYSAQLSARVDACAWSFSIADVPNATSYVFTVGDLTRVVSRAQLLGFEMIGGALRSGLPVSMANESPSPRGESAAPSGPTPVVPSPVKALDARHSPYVVGNASPPLAAGTPGQLVVISEAPQVDSNGLLAIVARNNTTEPVDAIEADATITDASGNLVATSSSSLEFKPDTVNPGEIAFGHAYFSGAIDSIPTGGHATIQLSSVPHAQDTSETRRDLDVEHLNLIKGQYGSDLVGDAVNASSETVNWPIDIEAACFDSTGRVMDSLSTFGPEKALQPKDSSTFSVDLPSSPCPVYLVVASGQAS